MVLDARRPIETEPLRRTRLPVPEPGPGEVLVRVSTCGICRTDLHVIEGELPPGRQPLIPGHQVVGRVERDGPGASRFRPGDRVGIAWLRGTCGACPQCRRGRENLCPRAEFTGYHADGGYAGYAVVGEAFAYRIPDALRNLAPGGTLSLAGIYMTPVPSLDYEDLFHERVVRSVTANTRADGEEFLAEAARVPVRPAVTTFPLAAANEALRRLKHGELQGSGVLVVDGQARV